MRKLSLLVLACALCGNALAQGDYPTRPIRFLVPLVPGGAADILARAGAEADGAAEAAGRHRQPSRCGPDPRDRDPRAIGSRWIHDTHRGFRAYDQPVDLEASLRFEPGLLGDREMLAREGADPLPSTPEAFTRIIAADIVKWAKVVKAAGSKVE